MKISKKSQYALRAIMELALRNTHEPVKANKIARSQGISERFLEVILNELKHGDFVESRRGHDGGYFLVRDAGALTVGEVLEYIEGSISIAPKEKGQGQNGDYFGNESLGEFWEKIDNSVKNVCFGTTFGSLVESERKKREEIAINYTI